MFKFSFRQQVLAGFAVSVILVFIVAILSYKSINQLESDSTMVEHTQRVIKTSTNLLQLLIDAETGMRGYVATGKDAFLDPYNAALPGIRADITLLRSLVPDNPVQFRRVDTLNSLVIIQLGILKANVDTLPLKGLQYMVGRNMLLNGKSNMDQIRVTIDNVKDTENKLLAIRKASTEAASQRALNTILVGSIVFLVIIIVLFFYIQETFERQKKIEADITVANGELEKVLAENRTQNWLLTGAGLLNEKMQGQQSEKELSGNVLAEICTYTNALTGTIYLYDDETETLGLNASYAFSNPASLKNAIKLNDGWIGQVAQDQKAVTVKGKLNDKLELGSSLLQQNLVESFIVPFFFEKQLKGVIEIAFADELNETRRNYILTVAEDIGIAVNTAQARTIMHNLLLQVQQQAEELEAQQEEMRVTNEELLSKTEMLQDSEEELRSQQEELRTINAELEEKANLLEEKNQAIEEARQAIDIKVQELETTGKYKSEFLANMSHELRTPLNSILVLAQVLKENRPKNLSDDQMKYAGVIFNAGNDLLTLINDILDLSKVESGKLELQVEPIKIEDILHDMESLFSSIANGKNIKFNINADKSLPVNLFTDKVRIEQVLKNLLSNAFKFTPEDGSVSINASLGAEYETVNFRIKDTGIGIPKDKQQVIFEAFQQADGSTSRKYGGTGLGLSISRELVNLLGGKITLTSEPGKGSEFVLTVPFELGDVLPTTDAPVLAHTLKTSTPLAPAKPRARKDDREPFVIIVEDDKNFADVLHTYSRDHGYKSMIINDGDNALQIIKENQPDAVILDIMLPGKDGWQILRELKHDEETSGIPVHLMSAGEAAANRVQNEGAISFLKKPIDAGTINKLFGDIMLQSGTKFKQILLIEDNRSQSHALNELMQNKGIKVDQAYDGETAFKMLQENDYQCVILDLNLPDISGIDLLDKIKAEEKFKALPVIINTAMELDKESVTRLMQYANAMVVKTNKSPDRLIDEVNLFLNKIAETTNKQKGLGYIGKVKMNTKGKEAIKGKKVLIVDDDMRNIFALSSALQNYDMVVETAYDGQDAINKLEDIKDIDIVLMDIMMPVMDGYEATRHIRKQSKWNKLPVIALTAKAMMDDREKCIAAGANDYITKPVDMDRLVSLMQLWLES